MTGLVDDLVIEKHKAIGPSKSWSNWTSLVNDSGIKKKQGAIDWTILVDDFVIEKHGEVISVLSTTTQSKRTE